MQKRQLIIVSVLVVLSIVTAMLFKSSFESSGKKKKKKYASGFKIQAPVFEVKNQSYKAALVFTGRVKSIDRIELFAEVSGVLKSSRPLFKEGNQFRKGATLFNIDDKEMRLSLQAKKATFISNITKIIPDLKVDYPQEAPLWEAYLDRLDPSLSVPPLPATKNKKLVYFLSGRNVNDAFYNIKSAEVKLGKYRIRAPFNGVVSTSTINPGTLVRVGQLLGEFISVEAYELEATISFKDLKFIKLGHHVEMKSSDLERSWEGEVYRIGNVINQTTQSINVYIKVKGKDLKEGMYLKGNVEGNLIEDAFKLPRILLQPDDQVYCVTAGKLALVDVEVAKIDRNEVIVKGLKEGTQLIGKPITRAIIGTEVEILK